MGARGAIEGEVDMKEWMCVQVGHHNNVGKTIDKWQRNGWRLNTYQATGQATLVSHYLLFEEAEWDKTSSFFTFPLFIIEFTSKLGIHNSFTSTSSNMTMKSLPEVVNVVRCPECGEPLARSKNRRYYCENKRCSVIYVKRPHQPAITRVTRASLSSEEKEQVSP